MNFTEPITIKGEWSNTIGIFKLPSFETIKDFEVVAVNSTTYEFIFDDYDPENSFENFEVRILRPNNLLDSEESPVFFSPL